MGDPATRYSAACRRLMWPELPGPVAEAIKELSNLCGGTSIVPVEWNENYIGVPFDVTVDLPTRGPVEDLDIRPTEPVVLAIHRKQYPFSAPFVFSDRKDFPADRLPHLNPTRPGEAASLCLHRGSLDDWFAEHSLREFVERIRSWLRDAARGRLIRETDRFEPTRFTNTWATIMFDPDEFEACVRRSWQVSAGAPGQAYFHCTVTPAERHKAESTTNVSVHVDVLLEGAPNQKNTELVLKWNNIPAESRGYELWCLGILLWPGERVVSQYFGHLPRTYSELRQFAAENGFPLQAALAEYWDTGACCAPCIPITMAVLRPQPLIGTASCMDWVTFLLGHKDGNWLECAEPDDEASVLAIAHRQPLAPKFAASLSGQGAVPGVLAQPVLLGCGAVGSKLSLHFAKQGIVDQLLVDEATLAPHHLVRHGLHAACLGKNKAHALKEEIKAMFGRSFGVNPEAFAGSALDVLRDAEKLKNRTILIDASASAGLLNALSAAALRIGVCRCEIADEGRLGILSYEGPKRNPRVDDLQAHLWGLAMENNAIEAWLLRHRQEAAGTHGPALEEITIGIGCSSTTMRLGDDYVAYHASQFAMRIRALASLGANSTGHIHISRVVDGLGCEVRSVPVPPVHVLQVRNKHGWTVRIAEAADEAIRGEFKRAERNETGGLLIGYVHQKRNIVYVTHILRASTDSIGTPSGFKRGVAEYPEAVAEYEKRTGGLLGYVGEWHTHPVGKAEPSRIDRDTLKKIRDCLSPVNMPTLMVIMAPHDGMKAFIYG